MENAQIMFERKPKKEKKYSFSFSSPSPLFSLFIIFPRNRVGAKIGDRERLTWETKSDPG
jgi:hypothetical protein